MTSIIAIGAAVAVLTGIKTAGISIATGKAVDAIAEKRAGSRE